MTTIDPRPTITDQEVARLPLAAGRADLLEEIMSTPVLDRPETIRPRRTPPGWAVAAAAAAAVALIAAVGTWLDGPPTPPGLAPAAPSATTPPIDYVVLEAPGWRVDEVSQAPGHLSLGWSSGDATLQLNRIPDELYDQRFEDRSRQDLDQPTILLGRRATTWAYTRTDHATMTMPEDGFYFEVRADGLRLSDYNALIEGLAQTDRAGFADRLPAGTVTPGSWDRVIGDLLDDVTAPDGFGVADVSRRVEFASPGGAEAIVTGAVGCAWLDRYAAGTAAEQQQALAALDGSLDWPLFQRMDAAGSDFPEVVAQSADYLRDGRDAAELKAGIC